MRKQADIGTSLSIVGLSRTFLAWHPGPGKKTGLTPRNSEGIIVVVREYQKQRYGYQGAIFRSNMKIARDKAFAKDHTMMNLFCWVKQSIEGCVCGVPEFR